MFTKDKYKPSERYARSIHISPGTRAEKTIKQAANGGMPCGPLFHSRACNNTCLDCVWANWTDARKQVYSEPFPSCHRRYQLFRSGVSAPLPVAVESSPASRPIFVIRFQLFARSCWVCQEDSSRG